jgi:hypothetical protein
MFHAFIGWSIDIPFGIGDQNRNPKYVLHGYADFRFKFFDRLVNGGDSLLAAKNATTAYANNNTQNHQTFYNHWFGIFYVPYTLKRFDKGFTLYGYKGLKLEWYNDLTDLP